MTEAWIEALKRIDLVAFLESNYGLEFRRQGKAYVCSSPFSEDRRPSFFVHLVEGHWLFNDFSSGTGGSIFDFVRLKEKLGCFSEAVAFLRRLLGSPVSFMGQGDRSESVPGADRPYDVNYLYERFRGEDPGVCRKYLLERKIASELVDALIREGTVVHNRHEGRSYCCFAVRDQKGLLRCLDNHEIEGSGKFVLGPKSPFSCEWGSLRQSRRVFVAEGIIDYLSVKSLESNPPPGLALLGNVLCFDRALLQGAQAIISAMDDDKGGDSALLDLMEWYPEKDVRVYDLEGHKDPNEFLLAVRSGKGRNLSADRKLELYREFQTTANRAELAERWGIDRSYLYEVVRDCEETLLKEFSGRKRGRPPKGKPTTLSEALQRIEELEKRYVREAIEREKLYCRSEFLELRLKWAEIEAAELRGEKVSEENGPEKKSQVKKKRKNRRSKK